MTYHGGVIMPTANVTAIFWGTSWANYTGDKISGMDSWYQGFGNSNYAKTSDEYTGLERTSWSHPELQRPLRRHDRGRGWREHQRHSGRSLQDDHEPRSLLATATTRCTSTDRAAHAGYCAWHSKEPVAAIAFKFAFFFKLDGDAGCDPQRHLRLHSQGLAAIANVSGHELSEARTDPAARVHGMTPAARRMATSVRGPSTFRLVTFSNGTQWKIQGEWSNAAYTNGTGYPNLSGQKGCLDGH